MILPARPAKRRNETRALTRPIEAALNRLPGVRVARNNTGALRDATGRLVVFGLGTGSADLVGIVRMEGDDLRRLAAMYGLHGIPPFGRVLALEVKLPGKRPRPDQARWARVVRSLGGFCCVVTSVDEAIAAVGRCRAGASE